MGDEMTAETGAVRITQREVYDRVVNVEDSQKRIESLLEKTIVMQEERIAQQNRLNESVEARLENHRNRITATDQTLVNQDGRITSNEADIRRAFTEINEVRSMSSLKEQRKPQWTAIVGAVAAMVAGVGSLAALFIVLANFTEAWSKFTP